MTKVLVTGGSGFIAAHVLYFLLQRGHSVITTVRSEEKANKIRAGLSTVPSSNLDFRIVQDIAQPNAFDEALKVEGLEIVIHVASPFTFEINDIKKDLLDPAINGTRGLLTTIKKNAPSVKKVIITSSFAAIVTPGHNSSDGSPILYTEKSWNPITETQALENPKLGYQASKTFAERAAWDFLEKEKPNFTISTINPPIVFGPVVHYLNSVESINTSNKNITDLIMGNRKNEDIDPQGYLWVDVRDVALAHVKAFELDAAAGNRLLVTAGRCYSRDLVKVVKDNFPDLADKLPDLGEDKPKIDNHGYDNSFTNSIIGPTQFSLEQCIVDTVNSLRGFCT